jgi:S-DNA-T family DNA segregation ATPase FtsK/SpoIIIE
METKMKMVKLRVSGSAQICASASRNGGLAAVSGEAGSGTIAPEIRSEAPIIIRTDDREKKADPNPKRRFLRAHQEELRFDPGGHYQIPPLHFLDPPNHGDVRIDEEALHKSSRILEAKLADFGIVGKVVEVRPGPVITTFDIEPAPGI